MPYETPKYDRVPIIKFTRAMKDIKEYNAMSDASMHFVRNMSDALSRIVYDVANEVMLESKLNYVPVLTGRLRSSGLVSIPKYYRKNEIMTELSYNTAYAFRQHVEHRSKSKYLEKPFEDVINSGIMEERISRKILQEMGF